MYLLAGERNNYKRRYGNASCVMTACVFCYCIGNAFCSQAIANAEA